MAKQLPTPEQKLKKRMEDAMAQLRKIAAQKTPPGMQTRIHQRLAGLLGVTGATVFNYIYRDWGEKRGNGFLVEALIELFEEMPDPVKNADRTYIKNK